MYSIQATAMLIDEAFSVDVSVIVFAFFYFIKFSISTHRRRRRCHRGCRLNQRRWSGATTTERVRRVIEEKLFFSTTTWYESKHSDSIEAFSAHDCWLSDLVSIFIIHQACLLFFRHKKNHNHFFCYFKRLTSSSSEPFFNFSRKIEGVGGGLNNEQ